MGPRYNVIEIMSPHPQAGKVVVVPVRQRKVSRRPLLLRNARYRLCNMPYSYASGFAAGLCLGLNHNG